MSTYSAARVVCLSQGTNRHRRHARAAERMTKRPHAARLLAVCLLAAPLAWALRPAGPRTGLHAAAATSDSSADGGKAAALPQLRYEHKSMDGALLADSDGQFTLMCTVAQLGTVCNCAWQWVTCGERIATLAELVVEMAGYPLEEHFVTTGDGYVLGTYRIPGPRGQQHSTTRRQQRRQAQQRARQRRSSQGSRSDGVAAPCVRPAVLLLHGLLDSSAAWVLNEPRQSLGFILADAGYDVWMGNTRGNAFSRNHTGLDPGQPAFWDFTWDDMAAYDVPALVGYVLQQSGCARLSFVGHSQGTTQMFAALASQPGLRERVSLAAMLAPAVHMRYIQAPVLQALAAMDADKLFSLLGVAEFLPSRRATADLFGQLCEQTPLLCASVITAVAGFNAANMNMTRLPTMVQYAPSGTSVKNLAHWAQAIRRSRERRHPLFEMYDYGHTCVTPRGLPQTCNMRVYNRVEPPSYDLGSIAAPLAIFSGGADRLADPEDVATLLAALSPDAIAYQQEEASYGHLDFTWGIDACTRVYPALLDLLRMYR